MLQFRSRDPLRHGFSGNGEGETRAIPTGVGVGAGGGRGRGGDDGAELEGLLQD